MTVFNTRTAETAELAYAADSVQQLQYVSALVELRGDSEWTEEQLEMARSAMVTARDAMILLGRVIGQLEHKLDSVNVA